LVRRHLIGRGSGEGRGKGHPSESQQPGWGPQIFSGSEQNLPTLPILNEGTSRGKKSGQGTQEGNVKTEPGGHLKRNRWPKNRQNGTARKLTRGVKTCTAGQRSQKFQRRGGKKRRCSEGGKTDVGEVSRETEGTMVERVGDLSDEILWETGNCG